MAQVAFDLKIGVKAKGLLSPVLQPPPELFGQPGLGQIGDMRRHPRDGEAIVRPLARRIVPALPLGIGHDRLPPHFVKGDVLGGMPGG